MVERKYILITGWLWYIWSHAVVWFFQAGYFPVVIDNLSNCSLWVLDDIKKILWVDILFEKWDIRDRVFLENIFQKYVFYWVLHFAWLKAVGESCNNPALYYENNFVWSFHLYQVMNIYWVKKIIFSSSATVYNYDAEIPYTEETPTWKVTNPYAQTKYMIEQIGKDFSQAYGFQVCNLRYFNPLWSHESGYLWENPLWVPNNIFPYIMKVAYWELPSIPIYWDDYETRDGTGVRDYIDIHDLIDGHIKAFQYLEKLDWPACESVNLGAGKWVSVLELIHLSEKILRKKITYHITKRRSGDIAEFYCNPDKANKILDWTAKTSIEKSILNASKYYQNALWIKN